MESVGAHEIIPLNEQSKLRWPGRGSSEPIFMSSHGSQFPNDAHDLKESDASENYSRIVSS